MYGVAETCIMPLSFSSYPSLSPSPFHQSKNNCIHVSLLSSPRVYKFKRRSLCTMSASVETSSHQFIGKDVEAINSNSKTWTWKGYSVNYTFHPCNKNQGRKSLLLVHGFGASVGHWRKNIKILEEEYDVYAIDLLGFGASDKPTKFTYTMESWSELILDFIRDVIREPTVLVGNSVGSLACVIAASDAPENTIKGLVLLNCAGGMNNKAIVDDWRIKLLFPLLWLIDFLLKQRPIAAFLFERVRTRDTLKKILEGVYSNKDAVDDELVEVIRRPANDPGALDVFISVVTGPPGPSPISLMSNISVPILILWGDEDPFTPLDGPVGRYFSSLPSTLPNISFSILQQAGHCPHDDRPDIVHEKLLPWLDTVLTN